MGVGIVDNDFDYNWVISKMKVDKEVEPTVLAIFKPFVYAIDYCPDGYYFSSTKSWCDFKTQSYKLEPGQDMEHGLD